MARLAERYELAPHPSLFERHRYLAGTDDVRTAALIDAFSDPGNLAVVCARGGSGAARLLPRIDFSRLPLKPLVGFSDNGVLHAALQSSGRISIHGPVVTQLADQPPWVSERLFALLEGRVPDPLTGKPLIAGVVEGPLLGGDLTVVATLLGTRWLPDMTGAILLLEEVDEPPYRIDRVWTHLRNAGVSRGSAASRSGSSSSVSRGTGATTRTPAARSWPISRPRPTCPASSICPSATAT